MFEELRMKMRAPFFMVLSGFLAACFLTGCSHSISVHPPESDPGIDTDTKIKPVVLEPFTVTIYIRGDGFARAAAVPDRTLIGSGGFYNFIQFIVVDKSTGKVHTLTDVRQQNAGKTEVVMPVQPIPYDRDYEFLLLMGHWNRDYLKESSGGNYLYDAANPPTLLAAGYQRAAISPKNKTVTIAMFPLVVDTKFTGATTLAAPVGGASLTAGNWNLTWELTQESFMNGFEVLDTVWKDINSGRSSLFLTSKAIIRGEAIDGGNARDTAVSISGPRIILTVPANYISGKERIGKQNSANFNLEYIPFSFNDSGKWTGFSGKNMKNGLPEWIIRNGVNDLAQNDKTDFKNPRDWGAEAKNGNGAVVFMVAPEQTRNMVLTNGLFEGPLNDKKPKIRFTAGGYSGTAEVRYAVVTKGAAEPGYIAYTRSLGELAAETYKGMAITLPDAKTGYEVYVILTKDGKMSAPLKIDATEIIGAWKPGGKGRFVITTFNNATTVDNRSAWSEDGGATWTEGGTLPPGNWNNIAYGNDRFITINLTGSVLWSENGGATWTEAPLGYEGGGWNITYGNDRFVAVTQNRILYSIDGKDWTTAKSGTFPYSGIAYGGSGKPRFVTVSPGYSRAAYSFNGIEWKSSAGLMPAVPWTDIAYGNGRFVAVANKNLTAAWSADNGETWTQTTLPPVDKLSSGGWSNICYGNGRFLVVASSDNKGAYSPDGKTWKTVPLPLSFEGAKNNGGWSGVAYGEPPAAP
jgi:hypothetical protein